MGLPAKRRRCLLLLMLWFVLSTGSTVAHWYAWVHPGRHAGQSGPFESLCKQVSNTSQTINSPAWFVAWFVFHRNMGLKTAIVVNTFGYAFWIGGIGVLVLARDRLRRPPTTRPAAEAIPAPALSRRAFLTDSVLISGAACAGGIGAYATFVTPWSLRISRRRVAIDGLPAELDGLRLVQLTDTHLGPRIPAAFIREAVELALSLKPDLFLLTGDYVHMDRACIAPAAVLFRPLTERRAGAIGTIGVLGNHDYYADGPAMSAALRDAGVRMIDNSHLFLDARRRELSSVPSGAGSLCIAGVDDLLEGAVDARAAFRAVPDDVPRVLLSHNPDVAELPELTGSERPRVDLMISGHTHGGQVRLPLIGAPAIPSRYGQKYAYGLAQGPAFPVLVSAGIGMSLLPVRVGVPPEIVEITLFRRADA